MSGTGTLNVAPVVPKLFFAVAVTAKLPVDHAPTTRLPEAFPPETENVCPSIVMLTPVRSVVAVNGIRSPFLSAVCYPG